MAEAASRMQAETLAFLANMMRDDSADAVSPDDLNPFAWRGRPTPKLPTISMDDLKGFFTGAT